MNDCVLDWSSMHFLVWCRCDARKSKKQKSLFSSFSFSSAKCATRYKSIRTHHAEDRRNFSCHSAIHNTADGTLCVWCGGEMWKHCSMGWPPTVCCSYFGTRQVLIDITTQRDGRQQHQQKNGKKKLPERNSHWKSIHLLRKLIVLYVVKSSASIDFVTQSIHEKEKKKKGKNNEK